MHTRFLIGGDEETVKVVSGCTTLRMYTKKGKL